MVHRYEIGDGIPAARGDVFRVLEKIQIPANDQSYVLDAYRGDLLDSKGKIIASNLVIPDREIASVYGDCGLGWLPARDFNS